MGIKFLFAWYDMWIGAYVDRKQKTLYVCLVPCFVIAWTWGRPHWRKLSSGLWERVCGIRVAWEYDPANRDYRWCIEADRNPPSAQARPGDVQPHVQHPTFRKVTGALEYVDYQYPLRDDD